MDLPEGGFKVKSFDAPFDLFSDTLWCKCKWTTGKNNCAINFTLVNLPHDVGLLTKERLEEAWDKFMTDFLNWIQTAHWPMQTAHWLLQ